MLTTFPQCNFQWNFQKCWVRTLYAIIDRFCLGIMKQYIDGYSLICFIVLYSIEKIITCKVRLLPVECSAADYILINFLFLSPFLSFRLRLRHTQPFLECCQPSCQEWEKAIKNFWSDTVCKKFTWWHLHW